MWLSLHYGKNGEGDRMSCSLRALQHGAAGAVLDNRVRLSVRAKNRLERIVTDDSMNAIGSRDYVAVLEINAIVIPGSNDGKRIRAGADYGRYIAIGPKESSNAGLWLVIVVKHGLSNHPKSLLSHYSLHLYSPAYEEGASRRLVLSPHIGGVTEGMFFRAHRAIWENIARLEKGEPLVNRVN